MESKPQQQDLGSVLSQVETLQKQLMSKEAEVKEARMREEEARRKAEELNSLNSKLTEAKREAMQEDFNSKIRSWITGLDEKAVPDPLKKEFLESCEKFAQTGNESGVWKVVCCASAAHQHQVNTIQKLTDDYNALKKTIDGGEFADSKKRKEAEPCTPASRVWDDLQSMCRSY